MTARTMDGRTAIRANVTSVSKAPASAAPRLLFIDNIRWAMILLVLSMHAADTYSPFGNWYYTEHPAAGPATTLFFLTYQTFLQGFFMALLFFVAGYFTPKSYDAKGPGRFLAGRLYRLGLPTLLYVAVIGPVTEYYIAHSWRTPHSFAHEMGLYVVRARFLSGTGPMWFCAALLIFGFGYAALRAARPPRPSSTTPQAPGAAGAALVVAGLALATFAVRIAIPGGTSVFNMSPADFPAYVIMFALGVTAGRTGWLTLVSDRFAWWAAGVCVGAAVLAWAPLLVLGGAFRGQSAAYAGGLHWQSAARSLWEALVCVGMGFGVLAAFRARLPGQGRVARFMSDNAFAVYVVHPPVLIGLALALAPLPLLPVPKFALLWGLSVLACFGLAAPLARRIPLVGRVLQ
ncbi:acyltransferase family protein [Phenylobacterium sp.]|uniref:acyltransferase family protein n=1 Tax=Phenylobacterium sp. TaxID=1871053 RepID=UPI003566AC5B